MFTSWPDEVLGGQNVQRGGRGRLVESEDQHVDLQVADAKCSSTKRWFGPPNHVKYTISVKFNVQLEFVLHHHLPRSCRWPHAIYTVRAATPPPPWMAPSVADTRPLPLRHLQLWIPPPLQPCQTTFRAPFSIPYDKRAISTSYSLFLPVIYKFISTGSVIFSGFFWMTPAINCCVAGWASRNIPSPSEKGMPPNVLCLYIN